MSISIPHLRFHWPDSSALLNDLDLASVRHLVEAMRSCRGAFIVVSHDPRFLDELDLTRRIEV